MHQADGNLLESGLSAADVTLFQELEPFILGSALHQLCLHDLSECTSRDVLFLSATEVNTSCICTQYMG